MAVRIFKVRFILFFADAMGRSAEARVAPANCLPDAAPRNCVVLPGHHFSHESGNVLPHRLSHGLFSESYEESATARMPLPVRVLSAPDRMPPKWYEVGVGFREESTRNHVMNGECNSAVAAFVCIGVGKAVSIEG